MRLKFFLQNISLRPKGAVIVKPAGIGYQLSARFVLRIENPISWHKYVRTTTINAARNDKIRAENAEDFSGFRYETEPLLQKTKLDEFAHHHAGHTVLDKTANDLAKLFAKTSDGLRSDERLFFHAASPRLLLEIARTHFRTDVAGSTGKMLGPGIYLADVGDKADQYAKPFWTSSVPKREANDKSETDDTYRMDPADVGLAENMFGVSNTQLEGLFGVMVVRARLPHCRVLRKATDTLKDLGLSVELQKSHQVRDGQNEGYV